MSGAPRIAPRIGRVEAENIFELPVVPNVVEVSMRVQHRYRQLSELGDGLIHVTDAQAGVEQQRAAGTVNKIRNHFIVMMSFLNGKHAGANAIDLEPLARKWNAFKLPIPSTRKVVAPVRGQWLTFCLGA